MERKKFHLGDVLSIISGRLISPRGMDGIYDILNFLTGKNLFSDQLLRAMDECKPYLLKQCPYLDSLEMKNAVANLDKNLDKQLEGIDNKEKRRKIVVKWLDEQVKKYGEAIEVEPISPKV